MVMVFEMWRLLSLVGITSALRSDFDFIREKCTCMYADPGPNFLPNDTVWSKEDNDTVMPYQCPRRKIRNKYGVLKFLVEVEEELRRNCNVADNCRRLGRRRNHDRLSPRAKYDYIVVGAGAAGAIVAGRLSAHLNRSVLLLEAGDVDPTLSRVPSFFKYFRYHNDTDWNFRTQYEPEYCKMSYGRCKLNHGRALGGSTIFNDMIYMRAHKHDCNTWYRVLGRKFRSCRDLDPYYNRFENNLDKSENDHHSLYGRFGPMPLQQFKHRHIMVNRIIEAAVDSGFAYLTDVLNGHIPTGTGGFAVPYSFHANGQRFTTARAYLHPNRENILVVLRAQVTKILFKGNHAYGLEYAFNEKWDDIRVVEANEEIIISAGVFNTAKLLLLSGIGPKKELDRLNISIVKQHPIGEEVKFHYGFRMRYALGYHTDHNRKNDWINPGVMYFIPWWCYLWQGSMVFLRANQTMLDHYWIDLLDEDALDEYLETGTGPMASNGLAQLVGLFSTPHSKDKAVPDIQIIFDGMQADCARTKKQNITLPFKDYYPIKGGDRVRNGTKYRVINKTIYWYRDHYQKRMRINADLHAHHSRIIDFFILLLNPRSTGTMTLSSTDPGDPPLIYPNFFEETSDMLTLFEGAKIMDKIFLSKSLGDLQFEIPVDYFRVCGFPLYQKYCSIRWPYFSPEGYWFNIYARDINITFIRCLARQYTVARYHQQGTVPIGKVVNGIYQLVGTTGLRVCDGSIISGPISASPQGTIMMFAEHLSEILIHGTRDPNLDRWNDTTFYIRKQEEEEVIDSHFE